jgi:GlpG protein
LRQIGTLPGRGEASLLADHLLTLGVATQVREEPDGWGLWVLDEDRLARARQEFDAFRDHPQDPRFQAAPRGAEAIRRESERLESQYRKNVRVASRLWGGHGFRRRPLTVALVAACIAVYLLLNLPQTKIPTLEVLGISGFRVVNVDGNLVARLGGLEDILHGQVWRLVTPTFMHFGVIHLLFDMWALSLFGSLIELRRGTRTLAMLVLVSAVVSNLGQALYYLESRGQLVPFGGMSGVVYALFGYVWMKGLYEPEQGMILHPSGVQMMLLWLVLGVIGVIPNVANGVHIFGLIVGVLCGLARL